MADRRHFDVVIIGAGIAGSSLAAALSGEGLSIALVEAQALGATPLPPATSLSDFDPRVSALTPHPPEPFAFLKIASTDIVHADVSGDVIERVLDRY